MIDVDKPLTITVAGRGSIKLGRGDYVTSGGEGHVYRKGDLAIKLWEDPDHAAKTRMVEKIDRLSRLSHPYVVLPEALATDKRGKPIGYVMPWVVDSWALPMAFTNDWRSANAFSEADAVTFAERMREVIVFAHANDAILGDGNELNILGVGREPRYIDTDSWIFPGFQGDKVLPTILDRHTAPFTRGADWFAWGVVTFQLLTGIHPYRGNHPDFKRHDLDGRMKANVSVLDGRTRLPPAVRSFSVIPPDLRCWYEAVFDRGERTPPPALGSQAPIQIKPRLRISQSGAVSLGSPEALSANPLRMVARDILLLSDGTLVQLPDLRRYGSGPVDGVYAPLGHRLAAAHVEAGRVRFGTLVPGPGAVVALEDTGIAARRTWAAEGRLFAVTHNGLLELAVRDLGKRQVATPGQKWTLNPDATVFGDGVALYTAMGAAHLIAPFGEQACAIVRVRDLDGLSLVSAVRRGRVAVASLIDAAGEWKRADILFAPDYRSASVTLTDVDSGTLTDVITDTGVLVRYGDNDKIILAAPEAGKERHADAGPAADMRLLAAPSGVWACDGPSIAKLSVS